MNLICWISVLCPSVQLRSLEDRPISESHILDLNSGLQECESSYLFPGHTLEGVRHGGAVVTHWPPTSEVGGSNPEPYVGKMVVYSQWLAVYSTEP